MLKAAEQRNLQKENAARTILAGHIVWQRGRKYRYRFCNLQGAANGARARDGPRRNDWAAQVGAAPGPGVPNAVQTSVGKSLPQNSRETDPFRRRCARLIALTSACDLLIYLFYTRPIPRRVFLRYCALRASAGSPLRGPTPPRPARLARAPRRF